MIKLLIYFNQRLTFTLGQHFMQVQVQIHVRVIQPCVHVSASVDLLPPSRAAGWRCWAKSLVKAASSSCNPKGYSVLTDTCSELTEHFLLQNMSTSHLADTL